MPNPNNALAAWQLAVIALVAVGTLTVWLVAVFVAARPSGRADRVTLALPGPDAAASGPGPALQDERQEAA
jgi:hypothetical protein